jgi:inner membrane protein involved in colicin E2 resistance
MTRNITAIVAILLCTSLAWAILGGTIAARTDSADSELGEHVGASWGKPQTQGPAAASFMPRPVVETTNGTTVTRIISGPVALPLEQSRVRAGLDLDQRQKGLLWFATYRITFHGEYLFRAPATEEEVTLKLPFPAPDAIYDDVVFRLNGQVVPTTMTGGTVSTVVRPAPGSPLRLEVGYRSQGLSTWRYTFGESVVQVRDFALDMSTNFDAVDFPQGTLSPTVKKKTDGGWLLRWKYANLVTGSGIGMVMPEKIQPGPLASRVSYFAPVSLLFFFFLIFTLATLKRIPLHPMHYFFLATSFFAFHLLLAYLADHISIHLAFAICSAVSIFLVVTYLRVVVSPRFAFVEAALAQLVYLVGFSYAFFFKGFTGLTITIGAIISLFLVMQVTARIDWSGEPLPAS